MDERLKNIVITLMNIKSVWMTHLSSAANSAESAVSIGKIFYLTQRIFTGCVKN